MSAPRLDPGLRIGSVTLAVGDLPASTEFYQRVLGLPLITRSHEGARLGCDPKRPALVLVPIAHPAAASPHSSGLFHVAWLHASRAALAATVRRVAGAGWHIDGASDHGVSEALYLSDPDGLGIEIYADRPSESWERPPSGEGVRMVTLPLDVEDLLAQDTGPQLQIDPGTRIGHVHLKVSDVDRAEAFYRDALGFDEQARIPSAAFLSAGGYHHHVGLNSWHSAGAMRAPESAPGLRLVEFELPGEGAVAGLEQALRERAVGDAVAGEGRLSLRDPDGQPLAFVQA